MKVLLVRRINSYSSTCLSSTSQEFLIPAIYISIKWWSINCPKMSKAFYKNISWAPFLKKVSNQLLLFTKLLWRWCSMPLTPSPKTSILSHKTSQSLAQFQKFCSLSNLDSSFWKYVYRTHCNFYGRASVVMISQLINYMIVSHTKWTK